MLEFKNLQFIESTEYSITYPTTLTILEYPVNEISNKPFCIKEHSQKYNLSEKLENLLNTLMEDYKKLMKNCLKKVKK